MKRILQALDKASSRKVEGANDMRRFVSIVQENNTLKKVADKIVAAGSATRDKLDDFRPYDEKAVARLYGVKTADNSAKKEGIVNQSDPKYVEYVQLMAKYDMLAKEMIPDNSGVEKGASPDAIAEINKIKAKAQQLAGANLQAWEQARQKEDAASMAQATANQSALAAQLEEAGKPGDPGFKPNTQIPPIPKLPNVQLQPGANDMGEGISIKLNPDGSKEHTSGQGLFKFDKNNKPIMYRSPNFSGLSQEHDLVTGNIIVRYMVGPLSTSQTYDKTGKVLDTSGDYTMGTTTVGMSKDSKGITSKRVTSTDPNNAPSGKDLYAMGDKDKEATYNRAMAQVNAPATEGKRSFLDYLREAEEKQKGVDGKACWDGYKRMGTKKKGGKTVDNCVPTGKK